MTVKELSSLLEMTEDGIRRAIKKALPDLEITQGISIDLDEKQTIRLLKHLLLTSADYSNREKAYNLIESKYSAPETDSGAEDYTKIREKFRELPTEIQIALSYDTLFRLANEQNITRKGFWVHFRKLTEELQLTNVTLTDPEKLEKITDNLPELSIISPIYQLRITHKI